MKKILAAILAACLCMTAAILPASAVEAPSENGSAMLAETANELTERFEQFKTKLREAIPAQPEQDVVQAQAASDFDTVRFTYTKHGNEATITGVSGEGEFLFIPTSIDGCTVTEIGDSAFARCSAWFAYIPSTVRKIGDGAFKNCTSLTGVLLRDGLREIGNEAFMENWSLEGIATVHGKEYSLTEEDLSIPYLYEELFEIYGDSATMQMPDSLEKIGKKAFKNCSLEGLCFGKNVSEISEECFSGCEYIMVGFYGDTIRDYAFKNVGSLALCQCGILKHVSRTAFQNVNASYSRIIYVGSSEQLFKVLPDNFWLPADNYEALGYDITYRDTGYLDISSKHDYDVYLKDGYKSLDPDILSIDSDGHTYTAKGVGQARLYNEDLAQATIYGIGIEIIPIATVSYTWWQWLIRIVLFGWIWY